MNALSVRKDRVSFKFRDENRQTVKSSDVKTMKRITVIKPKGWGRVEFDRLKKYVSPTKVKLINRTKKEV